MTKKHFKELAAMLKEHRRAARVTNSPLIRLNEIDRLEVSLIEICKRNNPRFNEKLFRKAATGV